MRLTFFGGARTVTGSNYLLDTGKHKILIDCGLLQGCHFCERRNWRDFPYDASTIDAVFVTHAHIDHTGRLPRLIREGFRGTIFSTPPTKDFAQLLLEDSVGLLADEAKDRGIEPLYTKDDLARALDLWEGKPYGRDFSPVPGVTVRFYDAGHVLGSAIIEVRIGERCLVFSGDLGNPPTPLLYPPEFVDRADYVVVESTYGNRFHEDRGERKDLLEDAIETVVKSGGTLMIPAFSFERTQELLFELNYLVEERKIARIPIFMDSPLAINLTRVYKQYEDYYNTKASHLIKSGDEIFRFPGLQLTKTAKESKAINDVPPPKVIIAGSGMLTGGRILHHARRYLPDKNSMLLIIGYQAAGSLGRRLLSKAGVVKIFRKDTPVRARVRAIGGYSAHADQDGLIRWLDHFQRPVKKVFAVHGEEAAALALVQRIRDHLGMDASAPIVGDHAEL